MTDWRARIAMIALLSGAFVAPAAAVPVVPDAGVVIHGSAAESARQVAIAHAAGVRWVSLSVSWSSLEPTQGADTIPGGPASAAWDDLAQRVGDAKAAGMNVELRLADAPQWASGRDAGDDPPTPAHLQDYAAFLSRLAGRLGASIDAYSPWNEPNRSTFWNPVDPDALTALQKAAYPAIKAADPTATVIYGPVVGRYAQRNTGYDFLRRSYELGAKGSFDVIGWNGYPGGPPESSSPVEDGVPAANTLPAQRYLRGLIDAYDPGRRVWLMEIGWSTCAPCDVSGANGVSEAQQADYLTRTFDYRRRYLSDIVDRIFWYEMRDGGSDRGVWDQNQGLLRADLSPKPSLAALAALAVDDADGHLPAGQPGTAAPPVPVTGLPPAAAKLGLPGTARSSTGGRTVIGRPRLALSKGVFTLRARISVTGGRATVRIDGYRGKRWRLVRSLRIRGSGTLALKIRDSGFVGFRIRSTVPGRTGFRAGRVIAVPRRLLRVS